MAVGSTGGEMLCPQPRQGLCSVCSSSSPPSLLTLCCESCAHSTAPLGALYTPAAVGLPWGSAPHGVPAGCRRSLLSPQSSLSSPFSNLCAQSCPVPHTIPPAAPKAAPLAFPLVLPSLLGSFALSHTLPLSLFLIPYLNVP